MMQPNKRKPIEIRENPQTHFAVALKAIFTLPKDKIEEYQREHKPFTKPHKAKLKK